MINQTSYEKWGDSLRISSENVVFMMLEAIFSLNKRMIKNPNDASRWRNLYEKDITKIAKKFDKEWKNWADYDLARSYLDGLNQAESQLKQLGNTAITKTILNGAFMIDNPPPVLPIPPIPGQVLMWFEGWENQISWLGVFRNAAYYNLDKQSLQILRVGKDIYRDIAVMAGESSFKEADIFTRRIFSQRMLNEYAKRGIQTITYKNGARHSIDDYCEMVGRSLSGRTAVQATLNRFFESGYTLVIVSSHFRACSLCEPYENRILSIEKHPTYESVDDAMTQGLFHARCYCKDTEVYTSNGWKIFDNVLESDKIFSLNPNNHIPEWINWKNKFKYKENQMIEFKSKSFDLLVTKNHKMYIGIDKYINKNKVTIWDYDEAKNCLNKDFKQLRCVNWIGDNNLKYNTFGYSKKQFAFLLGIYLSEGHIDKNRNGNYNRITITQYKKDCVEKIEKVLKPMGFYFSGNKFIKDNLELAAYLKQFGKQSVRYIPDFILNETQEIIKIFLDAFLIGDGNKEIKKNRSDRRIYFTSSKRMAEQIGECIIKIGKYPNFIIQKQKGKLQKHKNGYYIGNYDIWRIRENNRKTIKHYVSNKISYGIKSKIINNYNNMVYCLELEKYHIMLIRRNGKISWCMNCAHDVSAWFEGVSQKETPRIASGEQQLIDKYGYKEAQRIAYNAQQRQRTIERNIRNYKKRSIVALDDVSKTRADKKVREWQAKQREHLKENDFLRRKYEREQIRSAY